MRRVLLVTRHAKSAWDSGAPSDHARPLNDRGRKDAPRMGAVLVARGWVPDFVLCSDARRARETWERMAMAFVPMAPPVSFTPQLYQAGLDAIRLLARAWDPGAGRAMIVGHNPGWEALISELTGQHIRLTTCNVARLEGSGKSWPQALDAGWRLVEVLRPRELQEDGGPVTDR